MAALFALLAACGWGSSDFAAGYASRRSSAVSVVILTYLTASCALAALALTPGQTGSPTAGDMAWGLAAGVAGGLGAMLLFRGLARGAMAVVAPITATGAATLPVLFGLLTGESISPLGVVGIALALGAIVMISLSGSVAEPVAVASEPPDHPDAAGPGADGPDAGARPLTVPAEWLEQAAAGAEPGPAVAATPPPPPGRAFSDVEPLRVPSVVGAAVATSATRALSATPAPPPPPPPAQVAPSASPAPAAAMPRVSDGGLSDNSMAAPSKVPARPVARVREDTFELRMPLRTVRMAVLLLLATAVLSSATIASGPVGALSDGEPLTAGRTATLVFSFAMILTAAIALNSIKSLFDFSSLGRRSAGAARPSASWREMLAQPGVVEALLSGVGFGLFFVFISRTSEDAGHWPLVGARGIAVVLFAVAALVTTTAVLPERGSRRPVLLAGVLDAAAAVCFVLATRAGLLSVGAVLASLYPAATIILARLVTNERIGRHQLAGLALAGVAVSLLAI